MMEYSISIGDAYEIYEGTPEEIAELLMRKPETIEFQAAEIKPLDEDQLINYIKGQLHINDLRVDEKVIRKILDFQLKYLKKKGFAD